MKKIFQKILLILILSSAVISCNQKKQSASEEPEIEETEKIIVEKIKPLENATEAFKQNMTEIFKGYLTIKDDLVNSNLDETKASSSKLQKELSSFNQPNVAMETNDSFISASLGINLTLTALIESKDIEEQRDIFQILTAQVEDMIKKFGINEGTVYNQYCPMAFNNTGANWLSDVDEIKNPYFGDVMLECGEVKAAYTFN